MVRARLRHEHGLARPEQLAGLSGLQQMQAMLNGEFPPPPIAHTLDFCLIEVAHGRAVFQGRPQRKHYNPLGTVHGGWFATLLDSALGCAVHTSLEPGRAYTTLEFKVNLVRALSERVPLVRAIGELTHGGRQVATAEARLVGHDGKLYAHASTTCLIFDQR
ncbi:PaaI family thioesterase [Paucibacter sp. AS307]|uniref:PaaI family thioesterase n=1 Tax=Paucibacter soli TaxID=3133433 RepID=UPI0030A1DC6F